MQTGFCGKVRQTNDLVFFDHETGLNLEWALDKLDKKFSNYSSILLDEKGGKPFLQMVNQFIKQGGDPNFAFSRICIGENEYFDATCLQAVYLYWKNPCMEWNSDMNDLFEKTIEMLLQDLRLDLKLQCSEVSLFESAHFVKNRFDCEGEGTFLERATIAHLALAFEDFTMLSKLIEIDPHLLEMRCCYTKGKDLLGSDEILSVLNLSDNKKLRHEKYLYEYDFDTQKDFDYSLNIIRNLDDGDEEICGDLAYAAFDGKGPFNDVTRVCKVTLFHLAARLGNESLCGYLLGRKANLIALDSGNCTPLHHLEQSIAEGLIKEGKKAQRLRKILTASVSLKRSLPATHVMLRRNGYNNCYDPRTKLPAYTYEKLTKSSLKKNVRRDALNFKVDYQIPSLNRAKSDSYKLSGYQRGHMVPASNAVMSEEAMRDTFLLTNIAPQAPELNMGYWKQLEKYVKKKTEFYDLVEVFTGTVFVPQTCNDGKVRVIYEVIGNGVAVPTHFFKVLYLHKGPEKFQCAYLVPNREISSNIPLKDFRVTVSKIQELTGILFEWK